MVGSIEPFIRGLYNVAPKCIECGEIRQYWDDELCVKCRKKKESERMIEDCDERRICPNCGKVMVLCEDEKTYYQIWECDGCGHKEDEG